MDQVSAGSTADGPDASGLSAVGLTKRYAGRLALDSVDLCVSRGQVHGLLGANGAGKTTALRVLLGLVRPDAGTVRLLGRELRYGYAPPDGVAAALTAPAFHPAMTGRRTLQLLAGLSGGRRVEERVAYALDATRLLPRAGDRVGSYSLGMRSRLQLAAALLREPRLLLLDEPANGLDPAGRRDLRALLRALAADGVAVLLSSHDLDDVAQLCENVTVLQSGRVHSSGAVNQAAASVALRTSDDHRAHGLAGQVAGLAVLPRDDGGLTVTAGREALDTYVLLLGRSGVAVRELRPAAAAAVEQPLAATR